MNRGFSLIELLIAAAITALLAGAVAAVVPSLQAYFEHTPAAIDLQQRGRTALDVIAQAIRSADRVVLIDATTLTTIARRINGARGFLKEHQVDTQAALALSDLRCPSLPDVCGFLNGTPASIADAHGRFELFIVGSADPITHTIWPRHELDHAYEAAADVIEVDAYTFRLELQPDGSNTLVRETAAGAVQPIVDRVSALRFEDAFDHRGIDVTVTLKAHGSPSAEITRRAAIVPRNLP